MIRVERFYGPLSPLQSLIVPGRPLSFNLDGPGSFMVWVNVAALPWEPSWEVRTIWSDWSLDGDWQFIGTASDAHLVYHCFARRVS